MSCRNSVVRNNMIEGATDGGIVVFGSPGTQIHDNTIWILNVFFFSVFLAICISFSLIQQTLLGGINMVDYDPFDGDYSGTVVRDNMILGGFATDVEEAGDTKGNNFENAIIKYVPSGTCYKEDVEVALLTRIGIAVGPRTWFGDKFGDNITHSGTITGNKFSGAFSYAIAITSAQNFTIENNSLMGNTSFIGARGVNCSEDDTVPPPAPFIVDPRTTEASSLQSNFESISDGDSLTCVMPPNGGEYWPFGKNPSNTTDQPGGPSGPSGHDTKGGSHGSTAGIVVGVILGVLAVAVGAWFLRKWAMNRTAAKQHFNATKRTEYIKHS